MPARANKEDRKSEVGEAKCSQKKGWVLGVFCVWGVCVVLLTEGQEKRRRACVHGGAGLLLLGVCVCVCVCVRTKRGGVVDVVVGTRFVCVRVRCARVCVCAARGLCCCFWGGRASLRLGKRSSCAPPLWRRPFKCGWGKKDSPTLGKESKKLLTRRQGTARAPARVLQ